MMDIKITGIEQHPTLVVNKEVIDKLVYTNSEPLRKKLQTLRSLKTKLENRITVLKKQNNFLKNELKKKGISV